MKKKANFVIGVILLVLSVFSCQNPVIEGENLTNDTAKNEIGFLSLGYQKNDVTDVVKSATTGLGLENVRAIVITVADQAGNLVLNSKILPVVKINDGLFIESVPLQVGTYTIEKFLVIDDQSEAIFISPYIDSVVANQYAGRIIPLPVTFTIAVGVTTTIKPDVVMVRNSTAADFGYGSIGINIVYPDDVIKRQIKKTQEVLDLKTSIIEYDWDGKMVQKTYEYGQVQTLTKYEYNQVGLLIREYDCDFNNPTQENGNYYTHEYSMEGKLIKTLRYEKYTPEVPVSTHTFQYDASGKLIQAEYISNYGTIIVYYEYDADNRLIKDSSYEVRNNVEILIEYRTYTYDGNGNNLTLSYYDVNNVLLTKYTYEYDLNNKLIKQTRASGTSEYYTGYEYDQDGRMLKETLTNNNNADTVITNYTYEFFQ